MSKITNDGLTRSGCTHMATVGVKGLINNTNCKIAVIVLLCCSCRLFLAFQRRMNIIRTSIVRLTWIWRLQACQWGRQWGHKCDAVSGFVHASCKHSATIPAPINSVFDFTPVFVFYYCVFVYEEFIPVHA